MNMRGFWDMRTLGLEEKDTGTGTLGLDRYGTRDMTVLPMFLYSGPTFICQVISSFFH